MLRWAWVVFGLLSLRSLHAHTILGRKQGALPGTAHLADADRVRSMVGNIESASWGWGPGAAVALEEVPMGWHIVVTSFRTQDSALRTVRMHSAERCGSLVPVCLWMWWLVWGQLRPGPTG